MVWGDYRTLKLLKYFAMAKELLSRPQPAALTQDLPRLNRELAQLAFNERVLAMADRHSIPLLERLRYLCIVSSNLDELFEIRVSGLKAKVRSVGGKNLDADGYAHPATLEAVQHAAHEIVARQYQLLNQRLLPALAHEGVVLHASSRLTAEQLLWAEQMFHREVFPVLTAISLDPSHPFPRVLNKSLNFIVEVDGKDAFGRRGKVAVVQAPRILPRIFRVPPEVSGHPHGFITLSSLVKLHIGALFAGMSVKGTYQFRVTRDSDLFVDEEEVTDLRETLRGELHQRPYGDAVRLEVSETTPPKLVKRLLQEFGLQEADCYRVPGPVNLVRLMSLIDEVDRPDLKFPEYHAPSVAAFAHGKVFEAIAAKDILVHHPYESFHSVVEFLQTAARDPAVVAISMTIYRTGSTSVLMEALMEAARSGKSVTTVVELMARFDEETNINWASRLEEAGVHVVFGVVGMKTHAKCCLVVRREPAGLQRYVHLGTGNYQPKTAKIYEDFGLFSANPQLCEDVHQMFRGLTGLGSFQTPSLIWAAPFTLHSSVMQAIARETEAAAAGRPAHIRAKLNALVEPEVIDALYRASKAGVRIDLIVRGACILRPGVPGLSENIQVRSTIGRFLEHSRVFVFHDDGRGQVYLSSADWMDRNFFRRVEVAFPVLDPELRQRVIDEGLQVHLEDQGSSWWMQADGSYRLPQARGTRREAQRVLMARLGDLD